jgi:hypothetical protein
MILENEHECSVCRDIKEMVMIYLKESLRKTIKKLSENNQ